MKSTYSFFLFFIVSVFSLNSGYSQSGEIRIRFIGNCGLYLTDGDLNVYVDFPYKSGAHKYMKYDASELDSIQDGAIFLFTHRHTDHYSRKLVKQLTGKIYGNWNAKQLSELNDSAKAFSVKAIRTSHKFTGKHYSYVITWHGKNIYMSGDTGNTDAIRELKNIDWAFLNPWIFMNAKSENITMDTKMTGLYHLYPTQKIEGEIPDNLLILKQPNQMISIPY